ncbi:MAG: VWA domain-containing protein [Acidobacteriota bacterium]|nr:VWA domain-containing protein [Acidobacteriota bacterium]
MAEAAATRGHLLRNIVLFGRLLRVGSLDVTPTQLRDWVAALELVDLARKRDVKAAARAVLVSRRRDLPWFDKAFELFWQARDPRELEQLELGLMIQRRTERTKRAAIQKLALSDNDGESKRPDDQDRTARTQFYSAREALRSKDFAELEGDELDDIKRLMATMHWELETRRTRRLRPSRGGHRLDLRRTLRRNLAHGGELIDLVGRDRKHRRRPLVVICDISGSMEPYSRLLLHFIYAVSHPRSADPGVSRVEAFAFGTRLTRLTHELTERDVDRALQAAAQRIEDWGGGTRTGESLREFNFVWGRRLLGQGAAVLIISDGWDRGDVDLLGKEMERLHRSCHRLIWLNPLLGSPDYQPLTRGIVAALPHIDDFLPVHNLASLEQLGDLLAAL